MRRYTTKAAMATGQDWRVEIKPVEITQEDLDREGLKIARAFGLGDWTIQHVIKDAPNGDNDTWGCCYTNAPYLMATIEVQRGLEYSEAIRTLVHEYLHVVFSRLDQTAGRIFEWLPDETRQNALNLYRDALEETITRAMVPMTITIFGTDEGSDE